MTHIESRPSSDHPNEEYDFYVDCACDRETLVKLSNELKTFAIQVTVKTGKPENDEGV